ncbi:MAG: hypothetical protein WKG07_17405 [Hymenobacter sp.]
MPRHRQRCQGAPPPAEPDRAHPGSDGGRSPQARAEVLRRPVCRPVTPTPTSVLTTYANVIANTYDPHTEYFAPQRKAGL